MPGCRRRRSEHSKQSDGALTSAKTPAADSDWGSPLLSRRSAEVSAGASSSAATLSVCDRLLRLQEELLLPLNAGQVLTRAVHGCLLLSWAEVLAASGRQVQAGSVGDLSSCAPAMVLVCTRVWSGICRPRRKRTTRRQCGLSLIRASVHLIKNLRAGRRICLKRGNLSNLDTMVVVQGARTGVFRLLFLIRPCVQLTTCCNFYTGSAPLCYLIRTALGARELASHSASAMINSLFCRGAVRRHAELINHQHYNACLDAGHKVTAVPCSSAGQQLRQQRTAHKLLKRRMWRQPGPSLRQQHHCCLFRSLMEHDTRHRPLPPTVASTLIQWQCEACERMCILDITSGESGHHPQSDFEHR